MFPDGPFAFCRKESARFRSCPGQRRVPPALSGEVVFRICNTVRFPGHSLPSILGLLDLRNGSIFACTGVPSLCGKDLWVWESVLCHVSMTQNISRKSSVPRMTHSRSFLTPSYYSISLLAFTAKCLTKVNCAIYNVLTSFFQIVSMGPCSVNLSPSPHC